MPNLQTCKKVKCPIADPPPLQKGVSVPNQSGHPAQFGQLGGFVCLRGSLLLVSPLIESLIRSLALLHAHCDDVVYLNESWSTSFSGKASEGGKIQTDGGQDAVEGAEELITDS